LDEARKAVNNKLKLAIAESIEEAKMTLVDGIIQPSVIDQ